MRGCALLLTLLLSLTATADEYVTHLTNIFRSRVESGPMSLAGMGQYHTLSTPNHISGTNHLIYFTERGKNQVFRYNTDSEQIGVFNGVESYIKGSIDCLATRHDLGFFVCDQATSKVLSFNARGEYLGEYASFSNLAQPMAVAASPSAINILVADGLFDHVIIFTTLGTPIRSFGMRGLERDQSLNIRDMAATETEVYILDRMNKYIKVFGYDGKLIRSIYRNEVTIPTAIAVDYLERIYVADEFDDTIKVYEHDRLIETFGGTGMRDGTFRGITDLLAVGPYLYVVDSNNNRIQVYVINAGKGEK